MTATSGAVTARVRPAAPKRPPSLASNVRASAMWNMACTMLLRLSSIGITAIVAHILSPQDFGVFAVATTAFSIVWSFSELGITACITRTDLDVDACAPTLLTISLASNVVIAGLMVQYAQQIAAALGSHDGAGPVRVMGIVVVIGGISAVPTGQCYRNFKQDKVFLANALSFIPSTIVLLVLAKTGSGAMAFAWSRVAGQSVSYLVILLSAPRKYWFGLNRYALSVLYGFGVPLACANFVGFILLNVDYVVIGHLMGAAKLGTYVLAFNVATWSSTLLTGVLNSVAMPAFSSVKHNPRNLMDAMAAGAQAVVLVAAPMCTLVMALAQPFVLTLYGARWTAAATPLSILSLYGLIYIVDELFANMLAALGRPKFILAVRIAWLAVLIPAMAIGVHTGGIAGAATAHIVVIAPLVLPLYLGALKRATGVPLGLLAKAVFPPLAASVLAAFCARVAAAQFERPLFQLAAGLAAGGACYVITTVPQSARLLERGRAANPRVRRFLRAYYNAGRTFGLHVGPPPRHASHGPHKQGATHTDITRDTGFARALHRRGHHMPDLRATARRVPPLLPEQTRTLLRGVLERRDRRRFSASIESWSKPLIPTRESVLMAGDLLTGSDVSAAGPGVVQPVRSRGPVSSGPAGSAALRCLVVTALLDVGGMDEVVAFLARRLPEHGLRTAVLHATPHPSPGGTATGRLGRMLGSLGIDVYEADERRALQWIKRWGPDVITAHGAPDWMVDIAQQTGVPYVDNLHGMHTHFGADWNAQARRDAKVSAIVSVSDLVRQQYLAGNPQFPPGRIVTIPNGVDDERRAIGDRAAIRARLGLSDQYVFVSLARHCQQKNSYGLITAFGELARRRPEVHLVIAGHPQNFRYYGATVRLRDELPCRDRIHLRDHAVAPAALLAAADGFVLDSFFEGWSLASMEALFAGLPVVLSDVGGAREQVGGDPRRGYLVANPLGDPLAATWESVAAARFRPQANRDELVTAMDQLVEDRKRYLDDRACLAAESAARFGATACLRRHAAVLSAVARGADLPG